MKNFVILLLLSWAVVAKGQSCLGNLTFTTSTIFDQAWISGCATGTSCSGGVSFTNMAACDPTTALDACPPAPTGCGTAPNGSDLWYNFFATSTTATINVIQNTSFIAAIQAFSQSADCATLTQIGCSVAGGPSSGVQLSLSGLTVGNRYYFRVFGSAVPISQRTGVFCFCGSAGLGSQPLAFSLHLDAVENEPWARLEWSVDGNADLSYFEVERSSDAATFASIAHLEPTQGTDDTFDYQDQGAPGGTYYYRIKAVDNDGSSVHSNIVVVNVENSMTFEIVGNPCRYDLHIESQSAFAGTVLDVTGKEVLSAGIPSGRSSIDVSQLMPGIYFLRNDDNGSVRKFLVMRT
jgi:hypothetical protein